MKIIKIIIVVIAIFILGVIGLSAYNQFQKRAFENQVEEKAKELKNRLNTLGERQSRKLVGCRLTVGFGGEVSEWKCPASIRFVDKRKKASADSDVVFGADGEIDTLTVKASESQENSLVCAFPLPVEEGPRDLSGKLLDQCEITIGEAIGSPQLKDNDKVFIKDGLSNTAEDTVILEVNEAEMVWYKLPENSPLRGQPVSMSIHLVFDSRDVPN